MGPLMHGHFSVNPTVLHDSWLVEFVDVEKPWTQRNSGYASLATSYDQNFAIVEGQHFNPHTVQESAVYAYLNY